MGKKRISDDSTESNPPVKIPKVTEFSGTAFKTMLKEPSSAMNGLKSFVSAAKKLPSSDVYDVVEGYIKISMECTEIFKLLEGEKHLEAELILIFESLEMILLRTASDLSHFSMVGNAIVKKTVSGYMKLLQSSLHSTNHRFVRQCLSFLTALVSQGPEAAREVLNCIHISKSLSGLAKRKDKKGRPDVRMAFVQFVLSFLVSGDNTTIGQVLEFKELLPEILSTGIKEDRMSVVNLILSTLKTRVVLNKAISKTQKVSFFTPAVLANIASLYKWNGLVDVSTDDNVEEDSDHAGISAVRDLVHSFLTGLCSSCKHGISFHDASYGTAGRPGNIVLLKFLVGLKQATEDGLVADLVVSVLKVCPDILARYFQESQHSYTPRCKSTWQENVQLLKKIYDAQPEISTIFQTAEVIALPRLLSMIMVVSLPPVCNKPFFTQGLSLANTAAQLTTLSMTNFILKRANRNIEYLLEKSEWHNSKGYTLDMMEELLQRYREALSKILPDITSVIAKWQSLSKKENMNNEEKNTPTERSVKETDEKNEIPATETAEIILLKALILQNICLYQKVVPHLVSQCKFDFSKLLKGIVSDKGIREEVPPVLQYQILQLALDLPASKFSWFRIQDVADSESSGEKSVLYLLLKMFVSSSSSHLKTSTRSLILKVLKDSGVFEYTWMELEIWLNQLARVDPNQQETVIQFLERVLGKLVSSSCTYTDKVASLVQEAAYLQENLTSQEGETASAPVSHIDDVIDMLDVIMEGTEGEMQEFGPSLSEDLILQTFPFSVFVPAALEARNKLPADKGMVFEYLSAVLTDVLHCQREPLPFCLALLQYDKELVSSEPSALPHPSIISLNAYYSKWLPRQCQEELFKSPESCLWELSSPSSFTALMRAAYSQGMNILLKDGFRKKVEESLSSMSLAEYSVAVKQVLLYIKSTLETVGTFPKEIGIVRVRTLMGILLDVVNKLKDFQEDTNSVPTAEKPQEGSELFLEISQSPTVDANKEQILLSVLGAIFKHPCLEQWFLALELSALPPHTLNPVRLKQLCAQLNEDILALLKTSAPVLSDLAHLDLVCSYMEAIKKSVLKEVLEKPSQGAKKQSKPFQALLSLHSYLDSVKLNEVISKLLLLPPENLILSRSKGTQAELSVYGHAAVQILTESKASSSLDRSIFLSQTHLDGLGTLFLSCSSPTLEAFLLQTLSDEPGSAKIMNKDILLHCFQYPSHNTQAISSLLLQNCSTHLLCFEIWCLEPSNMEKLSHNTEMFLPLIIVYLQMASKEDPARPADVKKQVLKALKQKLLFKLSQCVLENVTKNSITQQTDALSSLIKLSANISDIKNLIDNLPTALQNVENFERWRLVDVITEKVADFPEDKETWRKSVVTAAVKCLIASYSTYKDQATSPSEQERSLLERLCQHLSSSQDITTSEWNSFVKNGLKYRFKDHLFLNTMSSLLEVIYTDSEGHKDLVSLSTIHMMTSTHSLFLPTMLDSGEEAGYSSKEALVSLLLCLVKKCPSVCTNNHFVVLLGAYGVTLSTLDQKILLLLQEYERNNVSLLKFQAFLWGPAAVEHHKTRKSLGASLWKQVSSDNMLALLNTDRMLQTVAHFPQQRKMMTQGEKGIIYTDSTIKDLGNIYDPCFLLPLFSAILRPECVIDCLKFVSSHAMGVTVMALSSYDPKVRAAAYYVLSCFYQHLEGSQFRDKSQLLYLMDMMKNGIRHPNQRLPFVLTTYVTKVAQQMLKPEDHMYVVLNRFLLSHQSLDFRRVPEFFKLFYGFDLEHKMEREWILHVLEEGMSDGQCFELCDKQGIFQILMGFSSSPLCDEHVQAQIMKVLVQAARITRAAYNLSKSCGLLSWIIQMAGRKTVDQQLLSAIIDLFHALWFTILGQKEKQMTKDGKHQNSVKCLPLPLINDFLCVALAISRHLRSCVRPAQLRLFLQTLCSVLRYRRTALSLNTQAGRLTFPPQPLSCSEVLSLLRCWAFLAHNTALLTQIQDICDKHQLKELFGQDKSQAKARLSRAQSQRQNLAEDSETEKQERSYLMECKTYLCSIFVYWEPRRPVSEPQLVNSQHTLDPSLLTSDAAHLLTKWCLRCLVEESYDENRTKDFLVWAKKAVLEHKDIMNAVLDDSGWRADLLRLHHRTDVYCHSSIPSRVEIFQIFTDFMMYLLEAKGNLPVLHQAVASACLSTSRYEAGLFLLSLYISEMWSGGTSAQMFLSHVRYVAKCKRQKNSKSAIQTAIKAICDDISSSMS